MLGIVLILREVRWVRYTKNLREFKQVKWPFLLFKKMGQNKKIMEFMKRDFLSFLEDLYCCCKDEVFQAKVADYVVSRLASRIHAAHWLNAKIRFHHLREAESKSIQSTDTTCVEVRT